MIETDLDEALLAAHAKNDQTQLVTLYLRAGSRFEDRGDIEAACFYYTHAYIFALETAHELVGTLNRKLVKYGREEPLADQQV